MAWRGDAIAGLGASALLSAVGPLFLGAGLALSAGDDAREGIAEALYGVAAALATERSNETGRAYLQLALRLRRHCRLRPLGAQLRVDGRRWQKLGVWQTALRNAQLRRAWRRGSSAEELASHYYEASDTSRC